MIDAVRRVVVETAVVVINLVCNPGVVHSDEAFYVEPGLVLGNVDYQALIDFGYVAVCRNCIFGGCYVKAVVLNLAFIDEIICNAGYVVAVIDVGQFVYFGQTLFSKGIDYHSIPVLCCSCHILDQRAKVVQVIVAFGFGRGEQPLRNHGGFNVFSTDSCGPG